jgi:hypothetical protein
MAPASRSARHAAGLYRRSWAAVRRRAREVEAEAEHLREVEAVGEAPETPFIAILGVVLFLLPIVALLLAISFGAYYLFS